MKLVAAALLVATALAPDAIPREVIHTRCQQNVPYDDEADMLRWVTRDGAIGPDVDAATCHKARFRRWMFVESFAGNVSCRPWALDLARVPDAADEDPGYFSRTP